MAYQYVPAAVSGGKSAGPFAQKQVDQQTAARNLTLQHANQGLAADESSFNRDQAGLDSAANVGNFTNFLDTLYNKGYLDKGDETLSSSSVSGANSGAPGGVMNFSTWTPTMPGGGGTVTPGAVNLGSPVASDAAAFAKAKDRVGASTQGLLKALQNQFAGRGLSGGSAEVAATGNTLLGAAGQLSDVARDEAIKEADDQNDFAKTAYSGGITQRGQDLAEVASQRSAALGARGQDISLEQSREDAANRLQLQKLQQRSPASILGLYSAFNQQPRY